MSSEGQPGSAGALRSSVGIIGGGVIGLSAAWRLAQRGWRVTVYDRERTGEQASSAGAGMLAPGGEAEDESPLTHALVAARALYSRFVPELCVATGKNIDFQQNGALELAYSEEQWRALQERGERQRALGIPSKPVALAGVRAFWPRVETKHLAGALFYPEDAIVDPRDLMAALRRACQLENVEVLEHTPVLSLAAEAEGVLLHAVGSEPRRFGKAIVAAGPWSGDLPVSGLPPLPRSQPVKGHLLGYRQPSETCSTILRHGGSYLLQRANGLLVAGASVEHVGFEPAIDQRIVQTLVAEAGRVLPHLLETTPTVVWTGFRPAADRLYVEPWHSRSVFLAYGHYRNGILLAPWTAERLQEFLGDSVTR